MNSFTLAYKSFDERFYDEFISSFSNMKTSKVFWSNETSQVIVLWSTVDEIKAFLKSCKRFFGKSVTIFIDNVEKVSEAKQDSFIKQLDAIAEPNHQEKVPAEIDSSVAETVVEKPVEFLNSIETEAKHPSEETLNDEVTCIEDKAEEDDSSHSLMIGKTTDIVEDAPSGAMVSLKEDSNDKSVKKESTLATGDTVVQIPSIEDENIINAVIRSSQRKLSDSQKTLQAGARVKMLRDKFFHEFQIDSKKDERSYTLSMYKKCHDIGIKSDALSTCLIFAGVEKSEKAIYEAVSRSIGRNVALVVMDAKKSYTKWIKSSFPEFYEKYPETTVLDLFNVFRADDKRL